MIRRRHQWKVFSSIVEAQQSFPNHREVCSIAPVLIHNGQAFILKVRSWRGIEGPGGSTEPNETPLEAACREFKEETGYAIQEPLHYVMSGVTHHILSHTFAILITNPDQFYAMWHSLPNSLHETYGNIVLPVENYWNLAPQLSHGQYMIPFTHQHQRLLTFYWCGLLNQKQIAKIIKTLRLLHIPKYVYGIVDETKHRNLGVPQPIPLKPFRNQNGVVCSHFYFAKRTSESKMDNNLKQYVSGSAIRVNGKHDRIVYRNFFSENIDDPTNRCSRLLIATDPHTALGQLPTGEMFDNETKSAAMTRVFETITGATLSERMLIAGWRYVTTRFDLDDHSNIISATHVYYIPVDQDMLKELIMSHCRPKVNLGNWSMPIMYEMDEHGKRKALMSNWCRMNGKDLLGGKSLECTLMSLLIESKALTIEDANIIQRITGNPTFPFDEIYDD